MTQRERDREHKNIHTKLAYRCTQAYSAYITQLYTQRGREKEGGRQGGARGGDRRRRGGVEKQQHNNAPLFATLTALVLLRWADRAAATQTCLSTATDHRAQTQHFQHRAWRSVVRHTGQKTLHVQLETQLHVTTATRDHSYT